MKKQETKTNQYNEDYSQFDKSAKRDASRRLRKIIREEIKDYLNEMDREDDPISF